MVTAKIHKAGGGGARPFSGGGEEMSPSKTLKKPDTLFQIWRYMGRSQPVTVWPWWCVNSVAG